MTCRLTLYLTAYSANQKEYIKALYALYEGFSSIRKDLPGHCITNVFATRRKNFSQWHRSFQRKLLSHWLKFLRHVAITLVIQGPVTWKISPCHDVTIHWVYAVRNCWGLSLNQSSPRQNSLYCGRRYFLLHFYWMKMIEFRFKFHWNMFPAVQLTISHSWSK